MPNVVRNINWKTWKFGLIFALVMSAFQVLANFNMVSNSSWNDIATFIFTTIGGAGFAYMQKHPIEDISGTGNTEIITKTEVK